MSNPAGSKVMSFPRIPGARSLLLLLLVGGLAVLLWYAAYHAGSGTSQISQPGLLRDRGVLYIAEETYQAEGVSLVRSSSPGGGPTQPITTTNEWWVDAQNPWRFRRATTELLADGPQIAVSDGSNGGDAWWELSLYKGVNQPVRHSGRYPLLQGDKQGRTEMTLTIWLESFTRVGAAALDRVQGGEAQQIDQSEAKPWGKLLVIQQAMKNKVIRTSTVQADAPQVLVAMVDKTPGGQIVQTQHITRWEWRDPGQFNDDFWLNPPTTGSP